jgi:hypothetical protein
MSLQYRQLSASGDYTFGQGQLNYLANSPATVAQVVETSLRLWLGEWYLNVNDGTPYLESVVGTHSQAEADAAILARINQCDGVNGITNYQSTYDPVTRTYSTISGTLQTIFGETQIQIENLGNF